MPKPNILSPTSEFDALFEEASDKNNKSTVTNTTRKIAGPERSAKFISTLASHYSCQKKDAFIAACLIFQQGGLSRAKGTGNIRTTVSGIIFEAKQINAFFKTSIPDLTPRQWAKENATKISKISKLYETDGNIHIDLQKRFPNEYNAITDDGKRYWASDFQGENQDCPQSIRELIQRRYAMLFPAKQEK
jgi:hypothetical protein